MLPGKLSCAWLALRPFFRGGVAHHSPPAPRFRRGRGGRTWGADCGAGVWILLPLSVSPGPFSGSQFPPFQIGSWPQEGEDGDPVERRGSLQTTQAESQHLGNRGLLALPRQSPFPTPTAENSRGQLAGRLWLNPQQVTYKAAELARGRGGEQGPCSRPTHPASPLRLFRKPAVARRPSRAPALATAVFLT